MPNRKRVTLVRFTDSKKIQQVPPTKIVAKITAGIFFKPNSPAIIRPAKVSGIWTM